MNKSTVRVALAYAIIIISFIPFLHNNITTEYMWVGHEYERESGTFIDNYRKFMDPFNDIGHRLVLITTWEMYSGQRRVMGWVDWYALAPDGEWSFYQTPNNSPAYRSKQSILDNLFFDFKEPFLQIKLSNRRDYRVRYGRNLCREMSDQLGWQPSAVKGSYNEMDMRPYSLMGNFSALTTPPDRIKTLEIILCNRTMSVQ